MEASRIMGDGTVQLKSGKSVTVRELELQDIPKVLRMAREVGGRIDWAKYEKLTVTEAALAIADEFPQLLYRVLGLVTATKPEAVATWRAMDLLKVLTAVLDVNDAEELMETWRDFFVRVRAMRAKVESGSPSDGKS